MINKLAGSVRQYKRDALLSPIFMIGEVSMEVIIPLLMAKLIDQGIDAGNMGYIARMGLVLVVCALVSMASGMLSGTAAARAGAGYARNLRQDMFYNVQNFSFSNIDKFSTASIVTRLTTDVSNIQMAFMMIIRIAVRAPVMLFFSLLMSFSVNWKLSLIFLITIPVLGSLLYLIIRNVHPIFERVFKTYDKLNNVVQENLRGIRVVKSFVREEHEKEKFNRVSDTIFKDFTKAEKIVAFNSPVMQFCAYGCMLLIAWFGARLIVSRELTTGQLMSLITYAMQILSSLMMLSMIFVMIIISRASAERVVEVLSEQPDLRNAEQPVEGPRDGSIRFQQVDFSYANDPNRLCLSGVNLEINSGQTIGIIGGTGSAKSTLVQLIPRLYDATRGTVFVGGTDVRKLDLQHLRGAVSVVLQKNVLFSGTIKENLRWGNPDADDAELERVCKLAQAHDFVMEFSNGYDTHIEQGGANVSGGQKQRLCIARALLKKPKILILDDSTSAVDTATESLIRKAFSEDLPDTTKIIIAQRISSVEDADKIIVVESGRINAVGTHEELLRNNVIYQEVYHSQTRARMNQTEVSALNPSDSQSEDKEARHEA